jgi:short-subunit dehydrogenase
MAASIRPLAVVTGASSGIGLELARLCSQNGYDLIIAADEPDIEYAATELAANGGSVVPVQCDLSTLEGVERVLDAADAAGRPINALLANAGRGLGKAFLDQDIRLALRVVHTNIDGTLYLLHRVGTAMRERQQGRILITGSIAGLMPGTFHAVYNGTKAFLDSFSVALRHELKDSGVTVTCLLPGATDTQFFARAGMLDTKVGVDQGKADPADVAQTGFDAMLKGEATVVHGLSNKMRAVASRVVPDTVLAELQRGMAAPGGTKS